MIIVALFSQHPSGGWAVIGFGVLLLTGVAAIILNILLTRQSRDITGEQLAHQNLRGELTNTTAREQLLLAAMADAVIALDQNQNIILFNPAAEELSGWDASSAQDVQFHTIVKLKDEHDQDITARTNPFTIAMTTQKPFTSDHYYFINKKKEKVALSIAIAPTYKIDHTIDGVVAILHDISEQKSLQRERNEFVSTASHEMRTPVAAIEGYLSMATNPKLAQIDDKARSYLEKAHQASVDLGRLFQDLLTSSTIDDHHLSEHKEAVNISEVLEAVAEQMKLVANQKGLSFGLHLGGNVSGRVVAPVYRVFVDPNRLREIFNNLLDNAIKYTHQGSVDIYLSATNDMVSVKIVDTGIGISPPEMKHLFQKFYRAESGITQEVGGTGLGLYITRSLVERYGGRIWAESTVGRGSAFTFTLPLIK